MSVSVLGEKSTNSKDSLESKPEVIQKKIVWELEKGEKKKRKKECNIQVGIWGKRVFLRRRNGWLLEQGKKVAKKMGKARPRELNSHRKKLEKIKKMKS